MAELRNRSPSTENSDAVAARRSDKTPRQADTRPRPRETPNRSGETPARPADARPHPAETGRRGAPRSGADRMRALYSSPNSTTPDAGPPLRPGRPGRTPGSPGRTPGSPDRTPGRTRATEDIDPRWLAGVPRPPDALPDDTGRAYLRWHRDRRQQDIRRSADDHPAASPPPDQGPADRRHPHIDRPSFQDRFDDREPPDRYGTPLERPDGTRVPCLNGRPQRGQAEQGWLGDCGVVATLGAVAAHRPGDISGRVAEQPDGTYKVRLNEAEWTRDGAAPTGQMIDLTVTPDLPVFDTSAEESAFAQPTEAAWTPVLEKAVAGLDQTWTPDRQEHWAQSWRHLCESDARDGVKNPRTGPPPDGYVRLNQGSTSWDRAELLTQMTGRESIVRSSPDQARQLVAVFARQLRDEKPVLAASRSRAHGGEKLPHNLEPAHAYEVIAVTSETVTLRNPWNRKQPEPMTPAEFKANMERDYTTLR